jgi:mannose-6-phosphate isomerase-like protein (cupin superfamily)
MSFVIRPEDWLDTPPRFHGEWQGGAFGSNVCVIANRIESTGGGPRLHKHPYAEVFIVREGRGLFTVGDDKIEAGPGQILVCPPDTPHKFENLGPGPLETIDIHEADAFKTIWLE